MSRYLPLATVIVFLGLLARAVLIFDSDYLPLYPLPGKNALRPTMAEVLARKEQLQQLEEDLNCYWKAKEQVAEEVIVRKRSLKAAIDEFRKLDQSWIAASAQQQMLKVQGISEDEWRGRNVISFVRRVLADRPANGAAVADRLEKELQKLLADRKKHRPMQADPWIKPAHGIPRGKRSVRRCCKMLRRCGFHWRQSFKKL